MFNYVVLKSLSLTLFDFGTIIAEIKNGDWSLIVVIYNGLGGEDPIHMHNSRINVYLSCAHFTVHIRLAWIDKNIVEKWTNEKSNHTNEMMIRNFRKFEEIWWNFCCTKLRIRIINVFFSFRIVIVPILHKLAVNTFTDIYINTMKRFALDLFRSPNLP